MRDESFDLAKELLELCQQYHPHAAAEALVLTIADVIILQSKPGCHDKAIADIANDIRNVIDKSKPMIDLVATWRAKQ